MQYLDDFLLYLQSNNYSPETIYNYERDLAVLSHYLKENKIKFNSFNKKEVEKFKAYLMSRDRKTSGHSPTAHSLIARSLNRILSSLRSYIRYLIEMDYPFPLAPEAIKLLKTDKKHARVAELNELIRLIESPTILEDDTMIGLRNRAMLEVLFSTGMRISELLNLRLSQIDNSGKIFIIGKGRKERFVYLTARAYKHLMDYINKRKERSEFVFIPYRGKNFKDTNKKISANYLQMKIKQYRLALKINVPTSAHSLRHGFATYLAESGANPAAIQILLGHESLDTTTRYVHASDRYAEKEQRKFHPLNS